LATPARRLAFRILLETERDRATLAELLATDEVEALDARERGFLHELLLGTLRLRGQLDHAIAPQLDRELERLDRDVLAALRLGAHQILNLRVPDRAAVSESVDLVREANPKAAGFTNAVLRRLAREGAPAFPDVTKDPLAWLTSAGSLPSWLAERWLARLGPARAAARAQALLEPPPAVFRLNPRLGDADTRCAALAPKRLTLPGAWQATVGPVAELAAAGILYPQDEGSQLVAHLAASRGRVLDACAAPGGKATLLADLETASRIFAVEPPGRRLATLARLLERWGAPNVRIVGADALRPPFADAAFDSVLLDAPCSGLGTIARHPDIRWRTRPSDLARHGRRQRALLESVAPLARAGGRVVYATCSSEPEENEDVVLGFLAGHADFHIRELPAWASAFQDGPFARSGAQGGDSFFAALLQRA
jgi:16S rRNA (cytosine967-C5)-methyltransferase